MCVRVCVACAYGRVCMCISYRVVSAEGFGPFHLVVHRHISVGGWVACGVLVMDARGRVCGLWMRVDACV